MSEPRPHPNGTDRTGNSDDDGDGDGVADAATTGALALALLQGILGVAMLAAGASKLAGADGQVRNFERWGYPQWFRVVTGATETLGGAGLLAGLARSSLGVVGGGLTAGTMLGAAYTHLVRVRDPPGEAAPAGALLTLAAVVTAGRLWRIGRGVDDEERGRPNDDGGGT